MKNKVIPTIEDVIKEHKNNVVNYLHYKMHVDLCEAEEIAMDTFVKVYATMDRYNEKYAFTTWLYRIAINKSIDYLRHKNVQKNAVTFEPIMDNCKKQIKSPEVVYIRDELQRIKRKRVRQIIFSLSPPYRDLLLLRYFHKYTYDDLAKFLNLPIGTVKAQIHQAKQIIKPKLQNGGIFN